MKFFIVILLFGVLIGCSEHNKAPIVQNASTLFLEDKGFQIVSYEGLKNSYTLTKDIIATMPYMMQWEVQQIDPDPYFGKTINVEKYIVKNHPLSKNGKVDVYVMEVDGHPIGGTSNPHNDKSDGGSWSIDGKTFEELHTKSFQEWSSDWLEKYSDR